MVQRVKLIKSCCRILICAFDSFLPQVYLNNIYTGVQIDRAFGFLAVLLILVRVEDVRAIRELRQVEVPSFEHLQFTAKDSESGTLQYRAVLESGF